MTHDHMTCRIHDHLEKSLNTQRWGIDRTWPIKWSAPIQGRDGTKIGANRQRNERHPEHNAKNDSNTMRT
ncbi:hypothetical protein NHX12_027515 [Muraenolepis orangiensis]|uniref:Uncharacterized protein n=1 Tax=Muraenolepis orangiensis TaxID=630683 RepID=A0A9Q0INW9_9TELE|nr:hypothetical protein NHX12_027515 [Muraenolepis orangiensis]